MSRVYIVLLEVLEPQVHWNWELGGNALY